jgi:hypothetical protein
MEVLILVHDQAIVSKNRSQYVFLSFLTLRPNLMGVPLILKFQLTYHFTQKIMLFPTNIIIQATEHSNVTNNESQVQKVTWPLCEAWYEVSHFENELNSPIKLFSCSSSIEMMV